MEKEKLIEIKMLIDDFLNTDLKMNNEEYLKKFIKLRNTILENGYGDISSSNFLISLFKEDQNDNNYRSKN